MLASIPWTVIDMAARSTGRRQFITGLLATGLIPKISWADAGSPASLSTAARTDGSYVLCGIGHDLDILFQIPLPARGHAAAAHPTKPQAVAFARRPGTFASVVNCVTGKIETTLYAPKGRHFYGHGTFSANGDWLFTTENDFEVGRGRIGIWDVSAGYTRYGEFDSGGIGPHDIKRLPNTDILVIANGGIDTHPDTGRTKLNIPTMRPNLSYIHDGTLIEMAQLPPDMHKNSIRHLAVNSKGDVAIGMQWQSDAQADALVGQHSQGQPIELFTCPPNQMRNLEGYIGSVAFSSDAKTLAVTSPRGGKLQVYDAKTGRLNREINLKDASGLVTHEDGFVVSSGTNGLSHVFGQHQARPFNTTLMWDNHLVTI